MISRARWWVQKVGWIFAAVLIGGLLSACVGAAPVTLRLSSPDSWTIRLPQEAAAAAAPLAYSLRQTTGLNLQAEGDRLTLRGSGGLPALRALLYSPTAQELLQPMGEGAQLTLSGAVKAGQTINLVLESNPSTGYAWYPEPGTLNNLAAKGSPSFETPSARYGTPLRETLTFRALADGDASLTVTYRRPWQTPAEIRRLVISAGQLSWLADLSDPNPMRRLTAFEAPAAAEVAGQEDLPTDELPASWDWKALGKTPAVRNQGACGSCWAFATVGVMESSILIHEDLADIDLSEQYLVSCNIENWGCLGGGTAHNYHWDRKRDGEKAAGAVLESAYPYSGTDAPCAGPFEHPYQIVDWKYAGDVIRPDVAAIKSAIYHYGPVKTSICSGAAFGSYQGGVFGEDETAACGGGTNHAVVLVGWDESAGPENGYWILRNSWGSEWGEDGYMRIRYGTSNVGRYASYVVYQNNGPATGGSEVGLPGSPVTPKAPPSPIIFIPAVMR